MNRLSEMTSRFNEECVRLLKSWKTITAEAAFKYLGVAVCSSILLTLRGHYALPVRYPYVTRTLRRNGLYKEINSCVKFRLRK